MRLESKQPGRVGKHRPWIRSRESFSFQQLEKHFGMTPAHVRVGASFWWFVPEVTPPVDDLFWRAAADPELEPPVADQIGRAGVLDHVKRVFVPHVDDSGADLDAACLGTNRCEQWERRRELPSKVVDAKVCAVRA